ncbi:MAG: M23 family metallopeptidase [Planctomycetes bacterium]|nr:M23 family metallopeptidase [Planctomycetota bacterium]
MSGPSAALTVTFTAPGGGPPIVSIEAIDSEAAETAPGTPPNTGTLRISRTGLAPLTVAFTREGIAKFGTKGDYTMTVGWLALTTTSVVVPLGQPYVDIIVSPVYDNTYEQVETVQVALKSSSSYQLDPSPAKRVATVYILRQPLVELKAPWSGEATIAQGNNSNFSHKLNRELGFENFYALDIAVDSGTEVLAPLKGTVGDAIAWDQKGSGGNMLWIKHDTPAGQIVTFYAHLQQFKVKKGDPVEQGQVIALSGDTGVWNGKRVAPHLHFHIWGGSGKMGNSTSPIYALVLSGPGDNGQFRPYSSPVLDTSKADQFGVVPSSGILTDGDLAHEKVANKAFGSNNVRIPPIR